MKMIKKNSQRLHAVLAVAFLILTTTLGSIPILCLGLLKLYPNQKWKVFCTKIVDQIAALWCATNSTYVDKINPVALEITGMKQLNPKDWYLVVANHQSWLDIVILQRLFTRKIPVLKFFIKDQLKWVPLLGFSWWAMGCPFMKRYSPAYLAKNPHKKGNDLKATKKALTLFKETPATLMSFIEGTRFTSDKKSQQNSPYQHLLKPKAGGVSFVIDAMNQQISQLLDVTIVYPHGQHSLWNFLCCEIDSIKIHVRKIPIPPQFLESSLEDEENQIEFRQWLNHQWAEKDRLIAEMKRC
jgi:1-acyl-sn-glycerol-3-phosphate acyltransferase